MLSFTGCNTGNVSQSQKDTKIESITENKSDSIVDNTKTFEKLDIASNDLENVVSVKSEASFTTKCQTMEEIYEKSPYIVNGNVKNTYFTVLEGMPYTVVDLEVREALKGDIKENSLVTVLLYGGYMTIEQEVAYYEDEFRFQEIAKDRWDSTYIEKKMTDGAYPKVGEEYVMSLMDNELSAGSYVPVNEYETIFKKGDGEYTRTLPSKEYFGDDRSESHTYMENDKSFQYKWFKKICKTLKNL